MGSLRASVMLIGGEMTVKLLVCACHSDAFDLLTVSQTRCRVKLRATTFLGLPSTNEANKEVVREARVQHLADEEQVGGQGGLQPVTLCQYMGL
jgi:hypothetical protein